MRQTLRLRTHLTFGPRPAAAFNGTSTVVSRVVELMYWAGLSDIID